MVKITYFNVVVGMLAMLLLPGCFWSGEKSMKEQSGSSLLVINVLEPKFYHDAHIRGSINVPFEQIEQKAKLWDKKVPIVVYCANYQCSASGEIAKRLTSMGFNAYAYEGGTAEWYQLRKKDARYSIEGPTGESYLEMVLTPSMEQDTGIKIVTAEQLLKMMQDAHLLK